MSRFLKHRGAAVLLRISAAALTAALLISGLTFFTQTLIAHHGPYFRPDQPRAELEAVLRSKTISSAEYDMLYQQTGLSPAAVDDFLKMGEEGIHRILEVQDGVYHPVRPTCLSLIGGRFTCEDLLRDANGDPIRSVPLAPLRAGDIFVSFSTHTLGWRHGHAGLVTDPGAGLVLEAVQMGQNSKQRSADHWRSYSNFMILRVKDTFRELGERVASFALRYLDHTPYSLLAGLVGNKVQDVQKGPSEVRVQCAYLPWLAWKYFGVDLDFDGGPLVTVADLAQSPVLEVVQVYGMDPELFSDRQARS